MSIEVQQLIFIQNPFWNTAISYIILLYSIRKKDLSKVRNKKLRKSEIIQFVEVLSRDKRQTIKKFHTLEEMLQTQQSKSRKGTHSHVD